MYMCVCVCVCVCIYIYIYIYIYISPLLFEATLLPKLDKDTSKKKTVSVSHRKAKILSELTNQIW